MVKERIDDLVDIIGEEYAKIENTFVIRNNLQLMKYLDNPEKWKAKQMVSRIGYRKELINIAKSQIEQLNAKAEKVYLLSYKVANEDAIKITEHEIVAENIPNDIKNKIKEMKKFNAEQIIKLANQSLKTYTKDVRIISQLSTPETLYDVVKKQMPKGIENGLKIVYKNKKLYSWKAYMEMNVRTTVHQEMTNQQMKAGASVGQLFYMCDSFSDSAPDHAPYQGKIYYNDQVKPTPEEQEYIDRHEIMSMQAVTNGEPYLTSRPNCRHNFHAIPSSQVLSQSAEKILKDNELDHGQYKGSNYEALMKQRYNERQIRKWKMREENAKRVQKETKLDESDAYNKAHSKVLEWQKAQRELIGKNKNVLQRQYDRENARTMVNDLGVKYDYKVVNGELKKK